MGAPEPDESETWVTIDSGANRFAVFARELNRTAGDSLVQAATRAFELYGRDLVPVDVTGASLSDSRLRGAIMRPEVRDVSAEVVPVYWVLVANTEGTVQEIGFYVNPEGASDIDAAEALADRIVDSLRAGSRTIDSEARTVYIGAGASGRLALEVPANAVYSLKEGPDFVVHYVDTLVPLGESGSGLGIYEGFHAGEPAEGARRVEREILGQTATWELIDESQDGEGVYRADLLLDHPLGGGYLHLFIAASSPAAREQLMDVVSSLSIAE